MTDRYEPNCDTETIASFFRMLEAAEAEIEEKLDKRDNILRMLAVEAGKTFRYEDQIYIVCERFNKPRGKKVPFLKMPKKAPIEWLGKKARAKRQVTPGSAALEESAQVEAAEEVCGDLPSSDPMPLDVNKTDALGEGVTLAAVVID